MRVTRNSLLQLTAGIFAGVLLASQARAVDPISVGPSGVGPLTFDTALATTNFFKSAYLGGSDATFASEADIEDFLTVLAATDFGPDFLLAQSGTVPPSVYAYGFRYNVNSRFIQSRAATTSSGSTTMSAGLFMLTTLQNDSGADQSGIVVSYTYGVSNSVATPLPGHRVYWSLTGVEGTWQFIPELSGVEIGGDLSAQLTLGNWPAGSQMHLLWVDDNGPGDPDSAYTIDNLLIQLGSGEVIPAEIADDSSLTNRTVGELNDLVLSIQATGNPISYQWYRDVTPLVNETNCVNGGAHVIAGARSATLRITGVQISDAGAYYCTVSNELNEASSVAAQITVTPDTTAPRFVFASIGANSSEVVLQVSEPLNDSCVDVLSGGAVSDFSTWVIEELLPGGGTQPLGVAGFTNMPSMTGARVIGFTTVIAPSDPANPIRITLVADLYDTSVAQNLLPANSSIFVGNFSNELVSINHVWRYLDDDVDPGPDWLLPGFDDGLWPMGAGPFDAKRDQPAAGGHCRPTTFYGLGDVGTCINLTSPVTMTNLITANFRTHFNFNGDPSTTLLRLEGKLDDGGVIYLNGQELQRIRLPSPSTRATFANAAVLDGDPPDTFSYLAPAALVQGDNVLAVELHQQLLTSSDLTFGLHVYANTAPLPRLTLTHADGNVTITWVPQIGQLEYTDGLSPASWQPIPGAVSGYSEPASGSSRFYRVVLP